VALMTVAVLVLVPSLAIVVVNRIETEVPAPLWTQDSLPAAPEADNGWTLIAHYRSTTISGIDLAPLDKLLAAARSGTPAPKLGRLFSPARVVAGKIRSHTKLCRDAFERKRLMVPCFSLQSGPANEQACTTEPLEICLRLVSFAAIDAAARSSSTGARQMATVVRQLTDAAANSPHPWVQARAYKLLMRSIHHAGVIMKWRRGDRPQLRESIRAISDASAPYEHIVIASYLLKHAAVRDALARTDTWLLDEGDIMRGLNAPFEVAEAGGELPRPSDHTDGLLWWFKNPIGKKMLDAVQPGADDDFTRTLELRDSVFRLRDDALSLK